MQIAATLLFLATLTLALILQVLRVRNRERLKRLWIALLTFDYVFIWIADWNTLLQEDYFISGPVLFAMGIYFFGNFQLWLLKPRGTLIVRRHPLTIGITALFFASLLFFSIRFGLIALSFVTLTNIRPDIPIMLNCGMGIFCWVMFQGGLYGVRAHTIKWTQDSNILFEIERPAH